MVAGSLGQSRASQPATAYRPLAGPRPTDRAVTDGEKIFDDEDMDWRDRMRESTYAHQERIDMAVDARIAEMDIKARAGRAYVVSCTPRLVTSAIQAKQLGKDILMWLGRGCSVEKLTAGWHG
jgi:hypothetical protein